MHPRSLLRRSVLAFALALTAGCRDAVAPREASDPFGGLGAGLHPVLVVTEAGPVSTYADVRLRRVGVDAPIAAFQAEVTFDATELTVLGSDFAPGVDGGWNEISPGRVRFAGAAAAGLEDVPLARLRFASRRSASPRRFGVEFQEVVAAGDFRDLTPLVAAQAISVSGYPTK